MEHKEQWDFYFSNIDGKKGSLYLDLGVHSIAPVHDKPTLIWVSIKMNCPREDGLSSTEESTKLFEIEDSIVARIQSALEAMYVGRATYDGRRDLLFYTADTTNYDKVIKGITVAYADYHFTYGAKEERDWTTYFDFLYPSPEQFQSIQNRHVIDQLTEHGDKLTKPREVFHWVYFKTDKDCTQFLEGIKADNFVVVRKDNNKKRGEMPFELEIKREDHVDQQSVDSYVLKLWKLAGECNGDYDGWETSVEKE